MAPAQPLRPEPSDTVVAIIPGRLSFWATDSPPSRRRAEAAGVHFITLGAYFTYIPFARDFGPFNIEMVYRYCQLLQEKLQDVSLKGVHIVHTCSGDPRAMANTACLLCMYQVIIRGVSAETAFSPFLQSNARFLPYCDATRHPDGFGLTIPDCLRGLQRAMELGWFSFDDFDAEAYERLDDFDSSGLSWIIPGRLLAFASPSSARRSVDEGAQSVEDYVRLFRDEGVTRVIRLSDAEYDRNIFVRSGIEHTDLAFPDGSCPPAPIIAEFLATVEEEPGAVAVHCKAGLGRTGTLIGIFAMKHFAFGARDFIAWARLCRPGSVLGVQQHFLEDMQGAMLGEASAGRSKAAAGGGDSGQGERLCEARRASKDCAGLPTLLLRPSRATAAKGRDADDARVSRAVKRPGAVVGGLAS